MMKIVKWYKISSNAKDTIHKILVKILTKNKSSTHLIDHSKLKKKESR